MTDVHHLAYGWFNPALAFSLAFLGSILGLGCLARATAATTSRRRWRWLALAAVSIGGAGVWLMHFMAMLGFDVPGTPVRYHTGLTALSMLVAVAAIGAGLLPIGLRRPSAGWVLVAGVLTGSGVAAMHYTGMAAVRVAGRFSYHPGLVVTSVAIAVVGVTVALWFTVSVRRGGHLAVAAFIMAGTVSGMHYTGMAAVRVELRDTVGEVPGVGPLVLIVPITVLAGGALLATSFMALQAMTEEELDASPPLRQLPSGARG